MRHAVGNQGKLRLERATTAAGLGGIGVVEGKAALVEAIVEIDEPLMEEYLETLNLNADMPEAQLNLGNYYTAKGDGLKAEKAYRQAINLSPAFTPATLNLADLYRANGLDKQAAVLLEKAVKRAPDDPATDDDHARRARNGRGLSLG